MSGAASGNVLSKYARTSSRVAKAENELSPVNGQKQVQVYEPSTLGSAIIMKPPARPDVERVGLHAEAAGGGRRDRQLLVAVLEE